MGRKRKQRRQPHGSAWHWKQTDCWYYTQHYQEPLWVAIGCSGG